ncbi:ParA family protein [bacterium]|nr:MAG: ParA family protein [bacterium]
MREKVAQQTKVLALANQKGGVGKTTTTINLGAYLAAAGQRVLIVDLDPQGNTSSGLGLVTSKLHGDLYDVLMEDVAIAAVVQETITKGLAVVPASPILAAAEVEMVAVPQREFKLKKALENIKGEYDYILIDCPPSLGILTVNGLVAADEIIIPVQAEFYALEGLGHLVQTVQRVRRGLNPKLGLLGVLLTMHNGRTTLSTQVHEEVRRHFPDKLFETVIPRNVRLAEAPSHGVSIMQYDGWSKGARSYKALAKEVQKRVKQAERVTTT